MSSKSISAVASPIRIAGSKKTLAVIERSPTGSTAQNAVTQNYLATLPGRDIFRERLAALLDY